MNSKSSLNLFDLLRGVSQLSGSRSGNRRVFIIGDLQGEDLDGEINDLDEDYYNDDDNDMFFFEELNELFQKQQEMKSRFDFIGGSQNSFDFLSPLDMQRINGVPVGLKNVGNKVILNSKEPININDTGMSPLVKNCVKLVYHLKILFARMIVSNQKYVDPSEVLKSMSQANGNYLQIGHQLDVGEFNYNFLEMIELGLSQGQGRISDNPSCLGAKKTKSNQSEEEEQMDNPAGDISSLPLMKKMSSLKLRLKKKTSDDTLISKLFFLKMKKKISFHNEKGELEEKISEEKFNSIMLDISHKNLNRSLEAFCSSQLEGFKTDLGTQVSAHQSYWIKEPPSTLMFQLHRVVFDNESKIQMKLNEKFTFEKEIYIDPFLEENQGAQIDNEEKIKTLKLRLQKLEDALEKSKNYERTNLSLPEYIESFEKFLISQGKPACEMELEEEDYLLKSPTLLTRKYLDVSPFLSVLEKMKEESRKKVEHLEAEIKLVKSEFDIALHRFKKHKYRLLSILVHNGFAASGHYYSFINDFEHKTWRRYDDMNVSKEQEENVFRESLGGHGEKNAYCLFYVKEETFFPDLPPGKAIRKYTNSMERESDLYIEYVKKANLPDQFDTNPKNHKLLEFENLYSLLENQDHQNATFISLQLLNRIVKELEERKVQFVKLSINFQHKTANYEKFNFDLLANFSGFLFQRSYRNDSNTTKLEFFTMWHTLNSLFMRITHGQKGIDDLNEMPKEFQHYFRKKYKNFEMDDLSRKYYVKLLGEYTQMTQTATLYNQIMGQVNDDITGSLLTLLYLKEKFSGCEEDSFMRSAKQLETRLLIKLCSVIIFQAYEMEILSIAQELQLLMFFGQNFDKNDLIFAQIIVYIKDIENLWAENNQEALEELKNLVLPFREGKKIVYESQLLKDTYQKLDLLMIETKKKYDPINKLFENEETEDYLINNIIANINECKISLKNITSFLEEMRRKNFPLLAQDREAIGFM